ncbi:hypothetical protein N7528_007534 [Penicillium herquei]|nr:hypothetical protein N7528_007534 [Penicillium herquei]
MIKEMKDEASGAQRPPYARASSQGETRGCDAYMTTSCIVQYMAIPSDQGLPGGLILVFTDSSTSTLPSRELAARRTSQLSTQQPTQQL